MIFLFFQVSPGSNTGKKKKLYSASDLHKACLAVQNEEMGVYRAARHFGVPLNTLKNRTHGANKGGYGQILSQAEEAMLVQHLTKMRTLGYNYSRIQMLDMATDLAVHTGKREKDDKRLSMQWFYSFMSRWPEIQAGSSGHLSKRTAASWEESLYTYFYELEQLMNKHGLQDKPHLVYSIDMTRVARAPKDVTQVIRVIGGANAAGDQIPPYFIFPNAVMKDDWMSHQNIGAVGTVAPPGACINYEVLRQFIKNHLIHHVQDHCKSQSILVIYNGNRSPVSLDMLDWSKDNNIVMLASPPEFSNIKDTDGLGCWSKFQQQLTKACASYEKDNSDICSLACTAYTSAMSKSNIQDSFEKAGIFPLKNVGEVIDRLRTKVVWSKTKVQMHEENQPPLLSIVGAPESPEDDDNKSYDFLGDCDQLCTDIADGHNDDNDDDNAGTVEENNKRKNPNSPLTCYPANPKRTKIDLPFTDTPGSSSFSTSSSHPPNISVCLEPNIPSGQLHNITPLQWNGIPIYSSVPNVLPVNSAPIVEVSSDEEEDSDEEETEAEEQDEEDIPEEDKCCVCKNFYVHSENVHKVAITNWAECDECGHWVHLTYCTPIHVVRKNTPFRCPCCPEK